MLRRTRLDLPGRTALITGAGSGIGAATASALVSRGAQVALVDLPGGDHHTLAAALGDRAIALDADVTDLAALEAAVAATRERFGSLDVVHANAGIAARRPATVAGTSIEEFERIVEIDLLGVWRTVRAALPAVVEAGGHVVITASIYAFVNGMVNAPYAASKAAVESLGRSLRAELAGTGATAGVVYPGWVQTPIIDASFDDPTAGQQLRLAFPGPLLRPVTPERLADAIVDGIERRAPRTICPRRWVPVSLGRGVVNVVTDAVLDRHRRMQSLTREIDARDETGHR
ncbi:short-subunit dehydrogenase [Knoellia remsis]|uniref:Short-subunit dehydrogenase n=1 Tax=Knoellia remsis TaxID=407159 RepID=A0A2T0UGV5_9MICO|nr:short-chain dehydrogenase/reductase [Knoellia remsis]PRY57142.1 short-subunit dehydrogenase [Knoellia remsis]